MLILENWPIERLKPYERNPRKNDSVVEKMCDSLKEFGFAVPVLARSNGEVVDGHLRLKAAYKVKAWPGGDTSSIPVVLCDEWSAAQVKAFRLMVNRSVAWADWDFDMLAIELGELKALDFDLKLTGFELGEIDRMTVTADPAEDDAPPVPEAPVTRPGDLWLLGEHRVLCGDSTQIDAVERLFGGNVADMVFTDPPYGMDLDTDFSSEKGNLKMLKEKKLKGGRCYAAVVGDSKDFDPSPLIALFAGCKEQFWWGADYYAERIPEKNKGSWVIWDKRLDESADRMYGSCFETCWSREKHKREIARVKWAGVFGTQHEPSLEGKKRVHPTQKPIALACWFFERWGAPGDIVSDLFLGSGSTLIACEKTERTCYGMELAPQYVDVIVTRWQAFTGKQATLDGSGATFEHVKQDRLGVQDALKEDALSA